MAYLQDCAVFRNDQMPGSVLYVVLLRLFYRNPDAALVIGALHIALLVNLQHGAAIAHVLLAFVGIPLLPDGRVQPLQGAGQRLPGGEYGSVAFGEGVQLQALRHFAALIEASDPVLAATSNPPAQCRIPSKRAFPCAFSRNAPPSPRFKSFDANHVMCIGHYIQKGHTCQQALPCFRIFPLQSAYFSSLFTEYA